MQIKEEFTWWQSWEGGGTWKGGGRQKEEMGGEKGAYISMEAHSILGMEELWKFHKMDQKFLIFP